MAAKRRKDPLWARIVVVLGVVLLVLSGGTLAAAQTVIAQANDAINEGSLLGDSASAGGGEAEANNIDGAVNLLLVGIDAREKKTDDEAVLSDTIIILHIPASHDQAYLISIPRDSMVEIPAYPKTDFEGKTDKVNASFSYGYMGGGTEEERRARGMDLLSQTLNKLTGIKFNGAALIDFGGFESIIHAMGGVDMCVDEEAESIHLGINDEGHIYQGYYRMRNLGSRARSWDFPRATSRCCTRSAAGRCPPRWRSTTPGSARAWTTVTTAGSATSSSSSRRSPNRPHPPACSPTSPN